MAQNENGEETQKSEHARRRVIVSSTIVLSLSEADGGRCGQQVAGQKVPGAPARTLYQAGHRLRYWIRPARAGPRPPFDADSHGAIRFSYFDRLEKK